jgi:L-asparaginase
MQAFVSPNYPVLATAGIEIQYNEAALAKKTEEEFSFTPLDEVAIGVLKVFPGINFSLFRPMLSGILRGVVLETFGSGNTPDDSGTLESVAEEGRETVLVVCSQCTQGTVNMSAYEAGGALRRIGAVSGKDMTTEAAVAKLYYLFSTCAETELIKKQIEKDLAGELTE